MIPELKHIYMLMLNKELEGLLKEDLHTWIMNEEIQKMVDKERYSVPTNIMLFDDLLDHLDIKKV